MKNVLIAPTRCGGRICQGMCTHRRIAIVLAVIVGLDLMWIVRGEFTRHQRNLVALASAFSTREDLS